MSKRGKGDIPRAKMNFVDFGDECKRGKDTLMLIKPVARKVDHQQHVYDQPRQLAWVSKVGPSSQGFCGLGGEIQEPQTTRSRPWIEDLSLCVCKRTKKRVHFKSAPGEKKDRKKFDRITKKKARR